MTITLDLTQEEEAVLQKRAARSGLTPQEYLKKSLSSTRKKAVPERSIADIVAEVLGQPEFAKERSSRWSEVESPCDAP